MNASGRTQFAPTMLIVRLLDKLEFVELNIGMEDDFMVIESERLYMQSPHEVSSGSVRDYYVINREFLKAFSPVRDASFYTDAYQENMLTSQIDDWEAGRGYRFYISLKEEKNRIIGTISLSNVVRGAFHSCFLGYQLDEEHANQGYMTEATRRIVDFAFQDLQLHRIEGNIIPRNYASRAVVEKCNFTMEGLSKKYLKINGVWEDHIHYVIINEEME